MTLEEYYEDFESVVDIKEISNLQQELISKLSEKDRYDFYAYLHISLCIKINPDGSICKIKPRKTIPNIWKFIRSSLPLLALFTFRDDKRFQRLYKKYTNGDKSVFKKLEEYYK